MPEPHAIGGRPAAAGLLAGRLLLAFIFVHEGWSIICSYSGAAAYMQRFGVPVMLLPAVVALEFGGGLLIVSGAFTRLVASLFAIFCILAAVLFHSQFADGNQLLHFQKDLAIAGGFLVLAVSGPGRWSVDRYPGLLSRPATAIPAVDGRAHRGNCDKASQDLVTTTSTHCSEGHASRPF